MVMVMVMPEPEEVVMPHFDRMVDSRLDRVMMSRFDRLAHSQLAQGQPVFQSLYGIPRQCLDAFHLCLHEGNHDPPM
jgi:hypothetical protein